MSDEQEPVAPPARPKLAPPVDWWELDNYERMTTLSTLDRFVGLLVSTYGLKETIVPRCWYRHEALVQELLALYQYRQQLAFLQESPPSTPIEFHQAFDLARGRLERWGITCSSRDHIPDRIQPWAVAGKDECQSYARDLEEWVTEMYMPKLDLDVSDEGDEDE